MFRCRLYGLVVDSAWPLDGSLEDSAPLNGAAKDLEVVLAHASEFAGPRQAVTPPRSRTAPSLQYARLPDGRDYLRWPGLFECLVTADGLRISGHPLRPLSPETIGVYMLTQAISVALSRRGVEPLHATAVVMEGKAVAFVGDCGYGKSTLAAACLQAGYPLLTDDLLVPVPAPEGVLARPGPARIKLMPSVARRLLGGRTSGARMHPLTGKLIIPLAAHQHVREPVPLHRVYLLPHPHGRSWSRITLRRVAARAAWASLMGATFNLLGRDQERLGRLLIWAGRLAQRLPVKSFSYPHTFTAMPRVVSALVTDVRSGASAA